MKLRWLVLGLIAIALPAMLVQTPILHGAAGAVDLAAVESNPWIVWEALNIMGEVFVSRQAIMTADDCTCNYSCGGLCPPCVSVRRAQMMGPFCSSAEAWATVCSRMTDRGRYAIGSPCPWWVIVDGVKHTVDWNPWTTCPEIGGDVVIPHPTCELPRPTATPTPTPTATPQADWDISIRAVEYTQAIQCLDASDGDTTCADNSIPLIRDKYTVIRVYPTIAVRAGREPADEDYMTAVLRIAGQEGSEILPINQTLGLNIEAHMSMDRNIAEHSLNFLLPLEWTKQASLQLELEVGSIDDAITDTNQANNVKPLTLNFQEQRPLRVLYVPIKYLSDAPSVYADEAIMRAAGRMLPVLYPLGQSGVIYKRGISVRQWLPLQGEDDHTLLRALNNVYTKTRQKNPATAPDQVFGWLPAGIEGFNLFAASDPTWFKPPGQGRVAYGRTQLVWQGVTLDPGRILAHEIAHNLDVYHVSTDDACGAQRLVLQPDWPYANAAIQETGYWPALHLATQSDANCCTVMWQTEDIMTYCEDGVFPFVTWTSPHTYKKIMSGLDALRNAPALDAAQDYLTVAGVVTPGGGLIETVELMSSAVAPDTLPAGSAYCLELQDAADSALNSFCFDAAFKSHSGAIVSKAGFYFVLPAPAATRKVALKHQGVAIDTRAASAHAPVVTITSPAAGASWSGSQTIRWTASDADGDAMTYSIMYSNDGATWLTAALDLTATTYTIDTAELGGGSQARLAVIANDGFLSGSAEVGPFAVARKTPHVEIIAPAGGTRFRKGDTISFVGVGDDLEDGTLPETAFAWTSSMAGSLGAGFLVQTAALPVGDHRITLTGHDAHGMTATAAITVQVRLYQVELPIIVKNAPVADLAGTPTPFACDLLFQDDFSAGSLAGWTASAGDWSSAGGFMTARSGALVSARNLRSVSAGDVLYEGTVTLRAGSAVGLSFRTGSASAGYDVAIDVYESRLKLVRQPNGKLLGAYSFDVRRDRPYRLRVEARGGVFDVYLDGVFVLRGGDGLYATGQLGALAVNSAAEFDNLRACRLSVPYTMRVNAGGAIYTDTQKVYWYEDKAYSAGGWGYDVTSNTGSGDSAVSGTEDDELYRTLRWAFVTFGYRFDVPNGNYRVRLLFVEPTFTQTGQRSFDVQIEGQTVLCALDLYAVAGHDNAYSRTFTATVTDGQLHVSFVKKVENPVVSGIEIVSLAAAPPTATHTTASTTTPSRTPTRTHTAAATVTGSRTPTRTATRTATRTPTYAPTPGAPVVTLYAGDARTFSQPPAVRAWANATYAAPPSGVTVTDSGGLWRQNEWVGLLNGGQWIQVTNSNVSTAAGVEFWGGNSEGWARVLVDGVERWRGSVYGDGSATYPAQKYLQVSQLPAAPHTLRVENLGIDGIGGWHNVTIYFFGFGPALP